MKNNDKVQHLTDREQARQKLSIWFDSRSNFYHPIREVIANGVDEINNHFESGKINVILSPDHDSISISDSGRGLPIFGEEDGKPKYEWLLETLFAGTKYDGNIGENESYTGTNGVGLTVINYSSEYFDVVVADGQKSIAIHYKDGGLKRVVKSVVPADWHGTRVTFKLDPTMYTQTKFDPDKVLDIIKHFAVASNKITFSFICGMDNPTQVIHFDSPTEYFDDLVSSQITSAIFSSAPIENDDENEHNSYQIAFTSVPTVVQESYLNGTYMPNGGTVNDGILDAVRLFGNKYCRANKMLKPKQSFNKEDVADSIAFVGVVNSSKVEFTGQTKLATKKELYYKQAKAATTTILEVAQVEQPEMLKRLFKHLIQVQAANGVNDRARKKLQKKLSENIENANFRVEKLVDSREHGPESELFIAEGNSALGSLIIARNPANQAMYPLRGKILNCLKASKNEIMKSDVIMDLIKIIGTGIEWDGKEDAEFSIDKARFGKIMIATDADADGYHISSLIITMFYKLLRPLLKNGRLFIVKTPLYIVKFDDDTAVYFHSEAEKNQKLPKIKQHYTISRLKGLGEVDADVMAETAMNPDTRNIIQVTVEDAKQVSDTITAWMGSSVDIRKKVIAKRLPDYLDNVD